MNPQNNQDYNRTLQELRAKLNKDQLSSLLGKHLGQWLQRDVNRSQVESVLNPLINWFNSLPTFGKVAVVTIAVLVGSSLLFSVIQLIASLISLAILGVILYLVYKFFVTSQSPK
ncbi:MAG TPA: hypothetical protein V6D11_19435 [Waterburya sp.]|jgi:ABC-type multidrug transport system fused ATPase/permease subunit